MAHSHISHPEHFRGVKFDLTAPAIELNLDETAIARVPISAESADDSADISILGIHIHTLGNFALRSSATTAKLLSIDAWDTLEKCPSEMELPHEITLRHDDMAQINWSQEINKRNIPVIEVSHNLAGKHATFQVTHVDERLARVFAGTEISVITLQPAIIHYHGTPGSTPYDLLVA